MKKVTLLLSALGLCLASSAMAADRAGDQVFGAICTACHSSGVMGAPRFGSLADWGPRIAHGKPTLYKHALGGFNSMPPKGGCTTCSDKEIKNAVDYMVKNAK